MKSKIDWQHLVDSISESRCHSIGTIADRLQCSKTAAWSALQFLCSEGLAWRNPEGKYRSISTRAYPLKSLNKNRSGTSERFRVKKDTVQQL